jgi:hypothetical protein
MIMFVRICELPAVGIAVRANVRGAMERFLSCRWRISLVRTHPLRQGVPLVLWPDGVLAAHVPLLEFDLEAGTGPRVMEISSRTRCMWTVRPFPITDTVGRTLSAFVATDVPVPPALLMDMVAAGVEVRFRFDEVVFFAGSRSALHCAIARIAIFQSERVPRTGMCSAGRVCALASGRPRGRRGWRCICSPGRDSLGNGCLSLPSLLIRSGMRRPGSSAPSSPASPAQRQAGGPAANES